MIRPPPGSTRTDTLFPYTTLCRSAMMPSHASSGGDTAAGRGGRRILYLSKHFGYPLGGVRIAHHHVEILARSEEHTSELQSLMRISYAVFCLKKKTYNKLKEQQNVHYEESNRAHRTCRQATS